MNRTTATRTTARTTGTGTLPGPARSSLARRVGHVGTGLLLAAALGSGLAACNDESDAAPSPTTADTHAVAVPTEACDAFVQLSALTFQMPEAPEEIPGFLNAQVLPVVRTITTGLPHEAAGAGAQVLDAYTQAATTGNPEALQSPELVSAQATVGKALHDGCEGTALDVTGVDYAYHGLPDEVPAGRVQLSFTDGGTEQHEIMIVKLNQGENLTLDQVLALPQEEAFSHVTPVAGTWGSPGETSYTSMDLEPGTYFALCNIPIGGGEQGAPHHTAGMKQTFVVR